MLLQAESPPRPFSNTRGPSPFSRLLTLVKPPLSDFLTHEATSVRPSTGSAIWDSEGSQSYMSAANNSNHSIISITAAKVEQKSSQEKLM